MNPKSKEVSTHTARAALVLLPIHKRQLRHTNVAPSCSLPILSASRHSERATIPPPFWAVNHRGVCDRRRAAIKPSVPEVLDGRGRKESDEALVALLERPPQNEHEHGSGWAGLPLVLSRKRAACLANRYAKPFPTRTGAERVLGPLRPAPVGDARKKTVSSWASGPTW